VASKTSDLIFRFIGKDDTGPASKSAAANLDHVGAKASGLGKSLAGLGAAAGVGVLASKVFDFAQSSVQSFETVGGESIKLQRIMGGNVEQMSALRGAAKMTGVSADTLATSMRSFSADIEGNSKHLQAMGVATRDAAGNIRPTGDVLKDVAAVFKDMPNGAEKSALAVQLFGRNGLDMIPMLNKGADGIAALEAKTAQYGLTLTQVDQDNLAKFRASQRDLSLVSEGVRTSFGKSLFPVLTEFNAGLVQLLPPLQQALTPALQSMGDVAVLAIRKMVENMPAIQQQAKDLATDIRDIAGAVERNWPAIVTTVNTLGDTLHRVAGFTGAVWDAFRSLPPEVQSIIAMLALAHKTGAINVAFSAAGLVKDMVQKVAGMSIAATVVNVNGASVNGGGGVPWAAGAGASLGMLGTATIVAAGIGAVVGPANVGTRKNYDAAGLDNTRGAGAAQWGDTPAAAQRALGDQRAKQQLDALRESVAKNDASMASLSAQESTLAQRTRDLASAAATTTPRQTALKAAVEQVATGSGVAGWQVSQLSQRIGAIPPGATADQVAAAIADAGAKAGLSAEQIDLLTRSVNAVPASAQVPALTAAIAATGIAAGLTDDQVAAMSTAVALIPPGAGADQLRAAIATAGAAAGLSQEQIDALTASALAVPGSAQVPALAAAISSAGAAAGLSEQQIGLMTVAASTIPPGATADQLRGAIQSAGQAAGLSQEQIDVLTMSAWNVPGSANIPSLQANLVGASLTAGLTTGQMDTLAAAVAGIPAGASVQEAGMRIYEAGIRAGVSSGDMDILTGKILNIPGWHHTSITSTAGQAQLDAISLQGTINALTGTTVNVKLNIGATGVSGSASLSGGGVVGAGSAAIGSFVGGQVQAAADAEGQSYLESLKSNVTALAQVTGTIGGSAEALAAAMEGSMGATTLNGHVTSNMCLANVSDLASMVGYPVTRHPYAYHQAQAVMAAGRMNAGLPPRGGLAWWSSLGDGYGHVAVGLGGGYVGNTWGSPWITRDYVPNMSPSAYLGWSDPSALALATGGYVAARVSAGEAYIPPAKVKGNLALLHAVNSGAIKGGARRFHEGLSVFSGPGTGTSDSIGALLPRGAYVVNAKASRESAGILSSILRGSGGYAGGGHVGGAATTVAVAGATAVEVHIDGRALHESLLRWRRTSGGAPLGLG
jgi:hypothetical protein